LPVLNCPKKKNSLWEFFFFPKRDYARFFLEAAFFFLGAAFFFATFFFFAAIVFYSSIALGIDYC
jgi:hypothetical protein